MVFYFCSSRIGEEMKKKYIVKQNQEFNDLIENAKYKRNPFFVCYYRNNGTNSSRFGISVGKKIGNAVTRNKLKRQVRAIVDEDKKYYSNGLDYIIMVRKGCLTCSYQEMKNKLLELLEQINPKEK